MTVAVKYHLMRQALVCLRFIAEAFAIDFENAVESSKKDLEEALG